MAIRRLRFRHRPVAVEKDVDLVDDFGHLDLAARERSAPPLRESGGGDRLARGERIGPHDQFRLPASDAEIAAHLEGQQVEPLQGLLVRGESSVDRVACRHGAGDLHGGETGAGEDIVKHARHRCCSGHVNQHRFADHGVGHGVTREGHGAALAHPAAAIDGTRFAGAAVFARRAGFTGRSALAGAAGLGYSGRV